ncbi:MAG: DUF4169 family protein [Alphaproteobacteria bacterium]|nr:DUF4169 family protein [Alphaproteobacteria bacterium]
MADIVNLRLARKAKARSTAEAQAAANRAAHGRSKDEKVAARREAERLTRTLDGARREDGEA